MNFELRVMKGIQTQCYFSRRPPAHLEGEYTVSHANAIWSAVVVSFRMGMDGWIWWWWWL